MFLYYLKAFQTAPFFGKMTVQSVKKMKVLSE